MDSGGIIHRAKALIPVLIPLFISSFRRANELATQWTADVIRAERAEQK